MLATAYFLYLTWTFLVRGYKKDAELKNEVIEAVFVSSAVLDLVFFARTLAWRRP